METQRKRLLFRAHHMGMQENDLLFGAFADRYLSCFSNEQLDLFEKLLKEDDADLFLWVTGQQAVPARLDHEVMRLLRSFQLGVAKA